MPRGKVFGKWRKDQYIKNHIPTEFQTFAKTLSAIQIEGLSAAIEFYRSRIIRMDIADRVILEKLGQLMGATFVDDGKGPFKGND